MCVCVCVFWSLYFVRARVAKKSTQKLSEDDQDILDLERVESSMEAAVNALKYEYTNSIIARITPGMYDCISFSQLSPIRLNCLPLSLSLYSSSETLAL